MTSTAVTPARPVSAWPGVLWVAGGGLFVVMVVHLVALLVIGGPVTGLVSLRKPATFAETGWLVAWSVALILPVLHTRGWQRAVVGVTVLVFGYVETAVMAIQAWRGVPSHYNFSTPFDAALMRGGAAGTAGVFLVGVIVLLVVALRSTGSASVRLGVVAGVVVLLVGCLVGLVMIFNNSGVFQGSIGENFTRSTGAYLGPDAATVGQQYLLLRPFTDGGDMVLPHAICVHGLLLLAVPAVLLARTAMPARRQLAVVAVVSGSVLLALVVLLQHAFRQLPLAALSPAALVVLAGCALALLGAYAVVGRTLGRHWKGA